MHVAPLWAPWGAFSPWGCPGAWFKRHMASCARGSALRGPSARARCGRKLVHGVVQCVVGVGAGDWWMCRADVLGALTLVYPLMASHWSSIRHLSLLPRVGCPHTRDSCREPRADEPFITIQPQTRTSPVTPVPMCARPARRPWMNPSWCRVQRCRRSPSPCGTRSWQAGSESDLSCALPRVRCSVARKRWPCLPLWRSR